MVTDRSATFLLISTRKPLDKLQTHQPANQVHFKQSYSYPQTQLMYRANCPSTAFKVICFPHWRLWGFVSIQSELPTGQTAASVEWVTCFLKSPFHCCWWDWMSLKLSLKHEQEEWEVRKRGKGVLRQGDQTTRRNKTFWKKSKYNMAIFSCTQISLRTLIPLTLLEREGVFYRTA